MQSFLHCLLLRGKIARTKAGCLLLAELYAMTTVMPFNDDMSAAITPNKCTSSASLTSSTLHLQPSRSKRLC